MQKIYKDVIVALTSQQKWDKAKKIIKDLLLEVRSGKRLHLRTLLKRRGFLVHLAMTYPIMTPYLKGLHLTVDSWRAGRDDEGWKTFRAVVDGVLAGGGPEGEECVMEEPGSPDFVEAVPRLEQDLSCLEALTESSAPAERVIRVRKVYHVLYGFGDASGTGFGSSTQAINSPGPAGHDKTVHYRVGVWGKDAEDASSNYRELRNLVEALEHAETRGELREAVVFLCTDNSTAEAAIYKGTSSNRALFDLVLRLKKLEMRSGCQILVSHVAGKRMIAQGTDGVSRGSLMEGVMAGKPMLSFFPFHLSAAERSPGLLPWIRSWIGEEAELLTPEGWFERGHDVVGGRINAEGMWMPELQQGVFVWAPPPAAADAAIEELRKARHKRQNSTHIVVVPRLMTPLWRKHLHKAADLVLEIPAGCGAAWAKEMFEPCLMGVCLPFLPHRPWQFKGTPRLLALERELRRLWEDGDTAVAAGLRQFIDKSRKLPSMPPDVVRRVLRC
jgi:hypothetical protein